MRETVCDFNLYKEFQKRKKIYRGVLYFRNCIYIINKYNIFLIDFFYMMPDECLGLCNVPRLDGLRARSLSPATKIKIQVVSKFNTEIQRKKKKIFDYLLGHKVLPFHRPPPSDILLYWIGTSIAKIVSRKFLIIIARKKYS